MTNSPPIPQKGFTKVELLILGVLLVYSLTVYILS